LRHSWAHGTQKFSRGPLTYEELRGCFPILFRFFFTGSAFLRVDGVLSKKENCFEGINFKEFKTQTVSVSEEERRYIQKSVSTVVIFSSCLLFSGERLA